MSIADKCSDLLGKIFFFDFLLSYEDLLRRDIYPDTAREMSAQLEKELTSSTCDIEIGLSLWTVLQNKLIELSRISWTKFIIVFNLIG